VSGVITVALIGAPIYAVLESRGGVSILGVITIGALPGIALLFLSLGPLSTMANAMRMNVSATYALIYVVLGISVAAATHLLRTWRHGIE
jgi:hypothetical protein